MPRADLFPDAPRRRQDGSAARRHLGQVIDAGNSDFGERTWAKLRCRHCGHVWETHTSVTVTELKRGLPCPKCNGGEKAGGA